MYCLKCGKDTADNQVFCDDCLQVMEAYPVKPGTHVSLPKHREQTSSKKSGHRKRPFTADEQISYLHKHLRRSRIFALILAGLLLLSSGMLLYKIMNPAGPIIGQNYIIDTDQTSD